MGDRGHIVIEQYKEESTPVVLYTHWKATVLPEILASALSKEVRWYDNEYLGRIIFDELSKNSSEFTGCGIGTEIHGDAWRVINVNPHESEITFEEGNGFANDRRTGETYSFEEFVEEFGQ